MSYLGVFLTFARNSLIRDMTFRANFIIELISSMSWMAMNLGFYTLVYRYTQNIAGWDKYEFFVFIATTMFVNSLVQAFFMPNAEELSEMVRTGGLDFALLKPIDTQFLVSLQRVNWSSLGNFLVALMLLAYAVPRIEGYQFSLAAAVLYPLYIVAGVLILYSVMITLAATSIWLGRNQSLYDFWFYITNFSRYPMEIYDGPFGKPLQWAFTFIIPILVVINVPAGIMAKPILADNPYGPWLAVFAVLATIAALAFSRWVFQKALGSYRSASS
ncbi:MAG: ABC-2 family transporter protein [Planctomycetales bacterium]|nr:ABC-2 family transporter protein [Planctomycetales bacterium]